jgi:hypothetical protein
VGGPKVEETILIAAALEGVTPVRVTSILFLAALCLASDAQATKCAETPDIVTSEVVVHVFSGDEGGLHPLPGAKVSILGGDGDYMKEVAVGIRDDDGYVRLKSVAPGEYVLGVRSKDGDPSVHSLRIPKKRVRDRLLGVVLGDICPPSCVMDMGPDAADGIRACLTKEIPYGHAAR